jgi:hypothetical protein
MSTSKEKQMTFEQALQNAMGVNVKSGEEIEREYVRDVHAQGTPKCDRGHATVYSHAVGACRCEFGALVRRSGQIVRSCRS